jgi:hypothetical protein
MVRYLCEMIGGTVRLGPQKVPQQAQGAAPGSRPFAAPWFMHDMNHMKSLPLLSDDVSEVVAGGTLLPLPRLPLPRRPHLNGTPWASASAFHIR